MYSIGEHTHIQHTGSQVHVYGSQKGSSVSALYIRGKMIVFKYLSRTTLENSQLS